MAAMLPGTITLISSGGGCQYSASKLKYGGDNKSLELTPERLGGSVAAAPIDNRCRPVVGGAAQLYVRPTWVFLNRTLASRDK